ncbi:MAG: guanine deaminase [Burkholderiales bacterium]|jgi:guanine deaminase|nr:guanine deaminase [Burkholderiales bacterium]
MARIALRGRLIDFVADPIASAAAVRLVDDGLLLIDDGRIVARGEYGPLSRALGPDREVTDFTGCLLLPGFVDAHTHFPQLDIVASASGGLLNWLTQHTYPAEMRFADPVVCEEAARFFLDELAANGTTSACVLGTVHAQSVEALFTEAQARGMRLVAGKCLMDRNCPPELADRGDQGMHETLSLAARWHGKGRLGYAITPRFAASSTDRQLKLAGELARSRPDLYVQSHLAENEEEVRWVRELFPRARSYLDVYESFGLLRERSVYAHCIWLDATDRRHFALARATAAVCPGSNLFLGSGTFDFARAVEAGMKIALATDVGGGPTLSMLATMRAAHDVARMRGSSLSATQLFYWATRGAAQALGWDDQVGTLESGAEADVVVLDPAATPLLAKRAAAADSVESLLFALMVLGDDRAVRETFIAGRPSKGRRKPTLSGASAADNARTRELARRFMGRLRIAPGDGVLKP